MLNELSYYDTSPTTFDELINLAVEKMNSKFDDDNHIVYLAWRGKFGSDVSCSHYAPKGKQTNWCGMQTNLLRSYPGWRGSVWVSYRYEDRTRFSLGSNILSGTGISSGTGGGGLYDLPNWVNIESQYREYNNNSGYGHYPLSWDSKIFELDFPNLSTEYIAQAKQQRVAAKLKGNNQFKYLLLWVLVAVDVIFAILQIK